MWKYCSIIFLTIIFGCVDGEIPKFRVLAPEFICPKDEDTPLDKPDNTIITLQTPAGATFNIIWQVRWTPLKSPTQRLTLMLWKTVRALEAKLNGKQPEPYVYVIEHKELLHGIKYVFNITAEENGEVSPPKIFHIDNSQGETKLDLVEGRADLLYVVLVGPQNTYADITFVIEALVTSCYPTQDYYFVWTVRSTDNGAEVDVSQISGSRLEIPPFTLRAGLRYDVNCQVVKQSTGLRITETGLPIQVLTKGVEVYLSADYLVMPVNQPFSIESIVVNHDYNDVPISFEWECTFEDKSCEIFETTGNDTLSFPYGVSDIGKYEIKVTVSVFNQSATSKVEITVVENTLPVLQITPISRLLNEYSKVTLKANASNVAPTCTLTWYFATIQFLSESEENCEHCQQGEALSDTLTIYSLEENFLNELTDFTNETEWRQVSGETAAAAGRARFVAECGCSITFACETKGMVYADLNLVLNESPKVGGIKIIPETGLAMETVFRISTRAVLDKDTPIRYSFYCRVNEDSLLLGSFQEHLAVETFLPYIEGGTEIWVEVCDERGACSTGAPRNVTLAPGDGDTIDMLIDTVKGHARRCELMQLKAITIGAIVTYTNAEQLDLLSRFSSAILATLPPASNCLEKKAQEYTSYLHSLALHGVDTSTLE